MRQNVNLNLSVVTEDTKQDKNVFITFSPLKKHTNGIFLTFRSYNRNNKAQMRDEIVRPP